MKRSVRRGWLVTLLVLSWPALGHGAAQQSLNVDAVVQKFMPDYMVGEPDPVSGPNSCYAVYSSSSDGTPTSVVAAYTDGAFGDLRMISISPTTLQGTVIAEVSRSQYHMAGAGCNIEIVRLSSSAPLSQVIQLELPGLSGRGEADWFFEWDGTKLINLGPISAPRRIPPRTLLSDAAPIDIEHQSVKQIISNGDVDLHPGLDGLLVRPYLIWKFDGTVFAVEKTLVQAVSFTRGTGNQPPVLTNITPDACHAPACDEFDVRDLAAQYKLTLINGNADGRARCSSGYIILNNQIIISPDDLNQNVEFITKTVTLKNQNTLYGTLASTPGNTVTITIEAAP